MFGRTTHLDHITLEAALDLYETLPDETKCYLKNLVVFDLDDEIKKALENQKPLIDADSSDREFSKERIKQMWNEKRERFSVFDAPGEVKGLLSLGLKSEQDILFVARIYHWLDEERKALDEKIIGHYTNRLTHLSNKIAALENENADLQAKIDDKKELSTGERFLLAGIFFGLMSIGFGIKVLLEWIF